MTNSPNRTTRVTIAYRGQELRIQSRETLRMRTPPSNPLQVAEKQTGFWFQVEDTSGRVLYRRIMHSPIRVDIETPSGDPERPLKRVPVKQEEGMFFLLVPLLPEARIVSIFSSPLEPEKAGEPAVEIFRFFIFEDAIDDQPQEPEGKPKEKNHPGDPGNEEDKNNPAEEE